MSKGGFDYSEFKKLAENFQKAIDGKTVDKLLEEFLLEMAFRAERKIKKRTPTDTGHLKRNWKVGEVRKHGSSYVVGIYNPVEYASYREYGHRTRDHEGWVEGSFMMTISMQEIERELPKFLEKRAEKLLKEILNTK
jgi:hypothetical protein